MDGRKISEATVMAAKAHMGQVRRFSGLPYIVHPLAVFRSLVDRGASEATCLAGLLHDVVEDSNVTLFDIEMRFGSEVRYLVDAVTRREGEDYEAFIRRTIRAGTSAILLKLADISDNESDLPDGHSLQRRYSHAKEQLFAALPG